MKTRYVTITRYSVTILNVSSSEKIFNDSSMSVWMIIFLTMTLEKLGMIYRGRLVIMMTITSLCVHLNLLQFQCCGTFNSSSWSFSVGGLSTTREIPGSCCANQSCCANPPCLFNPRNSLVHSTVIIVVTMTYHDIDVLGMC